ncbi:MAG: Fic family protein [Alteromonadaceae bacterium]|jgi:Fic family protein
MDIIKPNKPKAIMLAQREVATFVYDAVRLEGINFTLPEIQTLMEGVTVGGHALNDQQIAVNQSNAWKQLFDWLKQDKFIVSANQACELHNIAAKEEALEWGKFRSGGVTIAGTNYMPPPTVELPHYFEQMLTDMAKLQDSYDQAIHLFLTMARCQFFYDVNKRMGRFMMNGLLLSKGYPAINLPFSRQLEFNQLMLAFYQSGEQTDMNHFLRSCLDPRIIEIMNE